jgi:hypothetical protein
VFCESVQSIRGVVLFENIYRRQAYDLCDEMKHSETSGAWGRYGTHKKYIQSFCGETWKNTPLGSSAL